MHPFDFGRTCVVSGQLRIRVSHTDAGALGRTGNCASELAFVKIKPCFHSSLSEASSAIQMKPHKIPADSFQFFEGTTCTPTVYKQPLGKPRGLPFK